MVTPDAGPVTAGTSAERSIRSGGAGRARGKRVWIDLDNSPHIPFFAPIIAELERLGYAVSVTARDCFQVCALADLFKLGYRRIGRHYGKHMAMKALGTCLRAVQLTPTAWMKRPALAVSHGSRSQLIAAQLTGIPTIVICDYEFAGSVPGVRPTWVMIPEVIQDSSVKFGNRRILKYPGIKEDVYVPDFRPDPSILAELGLEGASTVVTLRPPANEAHYRNPESDRLLDATLELLAKAPETKIVLLPRNERQGTTLKKTWPTLFLSGRMIIPKRAVDGLNLMWHSDLVISGGGTMNREAAALGVPVYSIFRGHVGAVDRYLAAANRLVLLESVEDVRKKLVVKRRNRPAYPEAEARGALKAIVGHIVTILEASGK